MSVSLYGSGQTVVQVVSTSLTTVFTFAASSYTAITGLSASITPFSTSNKVIVMVNLMGCNQTQPYFMSQWATQRNGAYVGVATAVSGFTSSTVSNQRTGTDTNSAVNVFYQFLDSPGSTSAQTYQVYGQTESNSFNVNASGSNTASQSWSGHGVSTITLMEISYV
jgi:hypothetical protein